MIYWDEAKKLLGIRDRFTRSAIVTEFAKGPEIGAVTLDSVEGWYATPVVDNRYTVVWRKRGDDALVRAVVATQLKDGEPTELKDKLEKVVEYETKGLVKQLF